MTVPAPPSAELVDLHVRLPVALRDALRDLAGQDSERFGVPVSINAMLVKLANSGLRRYALPRRD